MVAPSRFARLRVILPALLLAAAGLAGAEEGTRWKDLTAAQQSALRPLEAQWAQIDAPRKQKWIEIAGRFPSLPPAERDRVQARMAEWAKLTPSQRRDARMNYQAAQQVPQQSREARWEAYQALPADQRRQLATPPAPVPRAAARPTDQAPQAKSNIVPNPAHGAATKAVAPTIVQARPGATTSLMSAKPAPPVHQQTGMPKIAATPGFVDKSTLLPQRGPQGAAVRSAAASDAGTGRP
jgi:hypothetical protein